jgi:acetylcholinesterase
MLLKFITAYTFFALLSFCSAQNDDLVVKTKNGFIRGKSVQYQQNYFSSKRVNAWLGIPFAEKPIGEFRFKRPVPAKNWSSVLDTKEWPNSCFQFSQPPNTTRLGVEVIGPVSEDCLYLNVWTPTPRPSKKTPVIVRGLFFLWNHPLIYI